MFLALYSAVCIGVTYFDDIKGYIQSKFRHEEKGVLTRALSFYERRRDENMKLQKLTKSITNYIVVFGCGRCYWNAILAAKIYTKSIMENPGRIVKRNMTEDPNAYTAVEAVRSGTICYIPAAITGTATTYIWSKWGLNRQQQASLVSVRRY